MKKRIICLSLPISILLLICMQTMRGTAAYADFVLPENLVSIEEEAFAGLQTHERVIVPELAESVGSRAFAGSSISEIVLPASLQSIASDAFEGVETPILIETDPDSAAVSFALRNNLDFRANTVCRALLIGQSAYPAGYVLNGPKKDLVTVNGILTDYAVTVKRNLSSDEILEAVGTCFADAKNEDISLFYYSGHGLLSSEEGMNGALIGIDFNSYVTGAQLRGALDAVPGRKIVLIDACYSAALFDEESEGGIVASGLDGDAWANCVQAGADPAGDFIRSFTASSPVTAAMIAPERYYILASSAGEEKSWEASYGGVFTNSFAESKSMGDSNSDGVVTFEEVYSYTSAAVKRIVENEGLVQTVQVYPENCSWFGIFR